MPLHPLPCLHLQVLRSVDDWQFDAFKLDRVTYGRPLSFLAFHLMNKMGLVTRLRLDANKLARCGHVCDQCSRCSVPLLMVY